jgi:hypothetical protein
MPATGYGDALGRTPHAIADTTRRQGAPIDFHVISPSVLDLTFLSAIASGKLAGNTSRQAAVWLAREQTGFAA